MCLKTGICLQWDTERPHVGISRQSDPFWLLGVKWRLMLELCGETPYMCNVWLRGKENYFDSFFESNSFIDTTNVLVPGKKNVVKAIRNATFRVTNGLIFEQHVSKQYVDMADVTVYWRIICNLTSDKPLSLQMNNSTIHLSTTNTNSPLTFADKFVQASIEIPPDMERLSEDFCSLLEKNILPDVKLICGGQTRSAHRSILTARSGFFSAMFRNKMVESETGIVDIPDMEAPVLDLLLKYVYSGKIPDLSDETAVLLYEAGDKYAMHSLKMACSDWMVRNLTEENYISFLDIADSHCDAVFKDAVIAFISNHQALFEKPTWIKFSKENTVLAVEVYNNFFALATQK